MCCVYKMWLLTDLVGLLLALKILQAKEKQELEAKVQHLQQQVSKGEAEKKESQVSESD